MQLLQTVKLFDFQPGASDWSEAAARAGFTVVKAWTDQNRWFSVQYLTPDALMATG